MRLPPAAAVLQSPLPGVPQAAAPLDETARVAQELAAQEPITLIETSRSRKKVMTRERWAQIERAWREQPTQRHIETTCKLGPRLAYQAIHAGFPEIGAAPLKVAAATSVEVFDAMAKRTQQAGTLAARKEAARQAADEATAARAILRSAASSAQVVASFAEEILGAVERGEMKLGPVTPGSILRLVTAVEKASSAVEKALKIERMRTGQPDTVVGLQIVGLMDQCSPEEMAFTARTGQLPPRLLGLAGAGADFVVDTTAGPVQPVPNPADVTEQAADEEPLAGRPAARPVPLKELLAERVAPIEDMDEDIDEDLDDDA